MRILLIGDAKELYVLSFARQLKTADPGLEIYSLDTNTRNVQPQTDRKSLFSAIYSYEAPFTGIAGKLISRGKRLLLEQKLKKESFDLYIAFGLWVPTCRWLEKITRLESKVLGLVLGTDFFKKELRPDKSRFNRILFRADLLATSNPEIIRRLLADKYDPEKLFRVELGLAPMEALESIRSLTRADAKIEYEIDPQTMVICCGYNASENQQHVELIRAIQRSRELPPDHLLLVPITYGGTEEYKEKVRVALRGSGLRYRLLEDFLAKDKIAMLWKAVDIFIQVQQTDCLSGSMMENLYCGNIVITGAWLPYQVLKERGAVFFEVDKIPDLARTLDVLIPQKVQLHEALKINESKFENSFWRNAIGHWMRIIKQTHSLNQ